MNARSKWLPSLAAIGALLLTALPVWAQVGTQGERSSSGSSVGQDQGSTSGSSSQSQSGMKQGQSSGSQGAAPGSPPSQTGMTRSGGASAGSQDIKKVQQALKEKGQDPGVIDGVMGPKTREALRAFQQQQGLNTTGTLDDQTKAALGIEGKSSKSAKSSKSGAAASRSGSGSSGSRGDMGQGGDMGSSDSVRGSGSGGPAENR
ncbi:MAG TPA: peptidoglycan-binding domain-containing protein [Candidatus Binatia bacterium]